jgi:hypothetical protein
MGDLFHLAISHSGPAAHEAGRSLVSHIWVSHITDEMLRMELAACRTLSTCLRVYDFCCYVHFDIALFDYLEGLRCGSYRRSSREFGLHDDNCRLSCSRKLIRSICSSYVPSSTVNQLYDDKGPVQLVSPPMRNGSELDAATSSGADVVIVLQDEC